MTDTRRIARDLDGTPILCAVCGKPFTFEEWDDHHENHEPFCNHEACDCNMPTHADCCPCVFCDHEEDIEDDFADDDEEEDYF